QSGDARGRISPAAHEGNQENHMIIARLLSRASAATAVGAVCLFISDTLVMQPSSSLVSQAEARIGRPLTPMSGPGVARRTARRGGYGYGPGVAVGVGAAALGAAAVGSSYYNGGYYDSGYGYNGYATDGANGHQATCYRDAAGVVVCP